MPKRTALIGTIVLVALVLSGCVVVRPKADGGYQVSVTAPGQAPSGESSTDVKVVAPPQKRIVKGAGQGGLAMPGASLETGDWKVQVDSIQHAQSLPDDSKPAAGKEFFIINVSIANKGTSAALMVKPDQFVLAKVDGTQIPTYKTPLVAFNAQQVKPVEVGTGGYTKFVYELPPGEANLRFTVTPNQPGAPGSMTWAVP